jgi:hypothetical protein
MMVFAAQVIGRAWSALALLLAFGGCDEAAAPAPEPLREYRPCPLGTRVGEFQVQLGQTFTAVSGSVASGVVPVDVRDLVEARGECRLLRKRNLRCDPVCPQGMTCGEGGACLRYPENQGLGRVTVGGLARAVTMTPSALETYSETRLPHPGFAPGADIGLRTEGGALAPFALRGWGVAALESPGEPLLLEPGKPLAVSWAAGPPGPARVVLALDIDQHGITPVLLECTLADAGAATVPAELVDALFKAGTSGFPRLTLARQTADSATLAPGCVQLLVVAEVERAIKVGPP